MKRPETNHGECYHFFSNNSLPSVHAVLSSKVGTLKLKKVADSYSCSLGCWFGVYKTLSPRKKSSDRRESSISEDVLIKMMAFK